MKKGQQDILWRAIEFASDFALVERALDNLLGRDRGAAEEREAIPCACDVCKGLELVRRILPRCARCNCVVTDHVVDEEAPAECRACDCPGFLTEMQEIAT
jgi:hypothetical protein